MIALPSKQFCSVYVSHFNFSSVEGRVSCFPFFAFLNKWIWLNNYLCSVMFSPLHIIHKTLWQVGSHERFTFSFLRVLHTVSGGLKSLEFYQYCLNALFPHNILVCLFAWLIFAILIWKDKNLNIVLIYIYILGSDNEQFWEYFSVMFIFLFWVIVIKT